MSGPDPIVPDAGGGKLRGRALTYAKWAIYAADLALFYLISNIKLGLGNPEVFVKFALLSVVYLGPRILIDYLENGRYIRRG